MGPYVLKSVLDSSVVWVFHFIISLKEINVIESSRVCSATVGLSYLPSFWEGEEEGDPKNSQNGSKITQKPRKDDNEQL